MQRSLSLSDTGELSQRLMQDFARRTGLDPAADVPRRYLWTDAFAVCYYVGRYVHFGDEHAQELAVRLIDQVHEVLGHHRADDDRKGWISGLAEGEGTARPTAGGLRIGKRTNERRPQDMPDAAQEWEQDGQYYHYLTKWAHALCQAGRAFDEARYVDQAAELMRAAHRAFVYKAPGGTRRMYWKMSIDLTRPLVTTMGQHDPLDGFLMCMEVEAAARALGRGDVLAKETEEMRAILLESYLLTDDPLGIGGLLADSFRASQLMDQGVLHDPDLMEDLVRASVVSMDAFSQGHMLDYPAEARLAFRELGLSIGIHALEMLSVGRASRVTGPKLGKMLDAAGEYSPLAKEIEATWMRSGNREGCTWTDHEDINAVMLSTSLEPRGLLLLGWSPGDVQA